jgi:hypothetical protein
MPSKAKGLRKAKPARPVKSVKSVKPAVSARPGRSAQPVKSATPAPATPAKAAKSAKPVTPARETQRAVRRSSAELHFTETTILRGEAVEPGEPLPSGATHEIAGQDDCGQPVLKRKRFSIY